MPLAINPETLFYVSLESDMSLPENNRPVFVYKYLTGLEQIKMSNVLDQLEETKSGKEAIIITFDTASIGLVGWKNMFDDKGKPIVFNTKKPAESLKTIMGFREAQELAQKVFAQGITIEDKKKFDSQ